MPCLQKQLLRRHFSAS